MIAAPPESPEPEVTQIVLFGWQRGPDGFVKMGMGAPYYPDREWEDMLYLGLFAGQDSGKSYAGAVRHLLYLQAWAGSVNIIAAPDFTRLERATLQTWKEVLASQGYIEGTDYLHNVTLKKITYWNGAIDYLCSLDNPSSVRGIRASSIWLDEAGYTIWEAMKALQPRMTRPGFPHQFTATSTPAPTGKRHWAYPFFFPRDAFEEGYSDVDVSQIIVAETGTSNGREHSISLRGQTLEYAGRRHCLFAETRENPHGGQEEWEQLVALLGEDSPEFEIEARGRFVVPHGLTYTTWRTDVHALPRKAWPDPATRDPGWKPDRVAMGGDFGVDHPAAWVVWGMDTHGREYVLDEWAKRDSDPFEMATEGVRLAKLWGAKHVFTDHDPVWFRPIKAVMNQHDIGMYRANKMVGRPSDPSGGIGMISAALRRRFPDDTPGLIVDRDRCPGLIREFENYQRPEEKEGQPRSERPVHIGDDRLDALRYVRTAGALRLHWVGEAYRRAITVIRPSLR